MRVCGLQLVQVVESSARSNLDLMWLADQPEVQNWVFQIDVVNYINTTKEGASVVYILKADVSIKVHSYRLIRNCSQEIVKKNVNTPKRIARTTKTTMMKMVPLTCRRPPRR